MTRDEAQALAARINDSGAVDTFGKTITAKVWEPSSRPANQEPWCRVYVSTGGRKGRQLGYFDAPQNYIGKSGKAVRRAAGITTED